MKLAKVLDELSSLEKNSFIKIIDNLLSSKNINHREVNKILNSSEGQLKSVDNVNVAKIFILVKEHYQSILTNDLTYSSAVVNLAIDILIRDGNCIMSREWFNKLFEHELKALKKKIKEFKKVLSGEEDGRTKDYKIYHECVKTAFFNDLLENREPQITSDEKSILVTLANQLDLSSEETRLIESQVIDLPDFDLEELIKKLKDLGCIFYTRKNPTIYVPDEIVKLLRAIKGKEIADKHFRRALRGLKDSHINLVARKHNVSRDLSREAKIRSFINQGIRFQELFGNDIFKEGINTTEKKKLLNDFISKDLKIAFDFKGVTVEDKLGKLIEHFNLIDEDSKVSISIDGYDSMLRDLDDKYGKLNSIVKGEFELQDGNVLSSRTLLDYNIKPRDILELIPDDDLKKICEKLNIKSRGDNVHNILASYKDSKNILIESYELLANRDYKGLQENGINIREGEIGLKFENVTISIFERLGLNIDAALKKKVNTSKNKVDIIIRTGENEVIVVECKTHKDSGYNKFSSVSRQVRSYQQLLEGKGYRVTKSLLVANDFSDDFVNECELEMTLNISLIRASTLHKIYSCFKDLRHKSFPVTLFMRDVVINEERVIKALSR